MIENNNSLAFIQINRLRNILDNRIFSIVSDTTQKIGHLALEVLQRHPRNLPCERLLIELLEQVNDKTVEILQKVISISKMGQMERLLQKTVQKKTPLASIEMQTVIDHLSEEKRKGNLKHSCLQWDNYGQLFQTQFPSKIEKQAQHLLQQLNTQYHSVFQSSEKLMLFKILFRGFSTSSYSTVDINEFLVKSTQLRQKAGEEVLLLFCESLLSHPTTPLEEGMSVLDGLISYSLIGQWELKKWKWSELQQQAEKYAHQDKRIEIPCEKELKTRLSRFRKDPTITQPLSESHLQTIEKQFEHVEQLCQMMQKQNFNQLINQAHEIREKAYKSLSTSEDRLSLIAIGRLAIRLHFGIYLYSTQILTTLGLFLENKSRQAQVKTGEGKSLIITLWAFVLAMECRGIDIITSARAFAKRDQLKSDRFFKRCDISSGHICHNRKTPTQFQCQILYGPAFDFEFAWMEDQLWGAKLYEARKSVSYLKRAAFDCVCVDESDNLLIDTAANGARLSYPAETSYDWVYAPILSLIKANPSIDLEQFKKSPPFTQGQMELLSDEKLTLWLQSGKQALLNKKGNIDYVVRKQRDEEGNEHRTIQIVDLKSGRISENSRWSHGIHEFLEVKHDIIVEKESLNPISLSHAVFYSFYTTVTALTGTAERFQTAQIYKIETFDVPPHLPLQRKDLPTIVEKTAESHYKRIVMEIQQCQKQGRPILILCLAIQDSEELAQSIRNQKIECQVLNEIQQESESLIVTRAGETGRVTVATNAAGRATDVILTEESAKNGGLHVIVAFYPDSQRTEDQAIGRAGRQGQPGSSQIILHRESREIKELMGKESLSLSDKELILALKTKRKLQEIYMAAVHLFRSQAEIRCAELAEEFFSVFRRWVERIENNSLLEFYSHRLTSIEYLKKSISLEELKGRDLQLAEECFRLLTTQTSMLSWKYFLSSVVDRLKQKVLVAWSLHFYQPIQEYLQGTYQEDRANEVTKLFKTHCSKWDSYLQSELGIFIYLQEITGIKFTMIMKN